MYSTHQQKEKQNSFTLHYSLAIYAFLGQGYGKHVAQWVSYFAQVY